MGSYLVFQGNIYIYIENMQLILTERLDSSEQRYFARESFFLSVMSLNPVQVNRK